MSSIRMFWIFLVLWIMFLQPVLISCETTGPVGGITRPNYGVDFNFLFQLNNMHGTWKHAWTFSIDLLDRMPFKPGRIQCFNEQSPICEAEIDFLNSTYYQFSEFLKRSGEHHEWLRDPQVLATLERGAGREKRALLPFVGDLEHYLFGVATDSEIKGLKKTIEDMNDLSASTVKQITNLGENLASLTQLTNSINANTKSGLNQLHSLVTNVTNQINERMRTMNSLYKISTSRLDNLESEIVRSWVLREHLLQMMLAILEVQQADLRILAGIQTTLQGYIPIEWVSPADLRQGLAVAEEGIRKRFPSARLSHSERALGFYYTHKLVTPLIEQNRITLIVDIPVDLGQQILSVYAVRRFPVSFLGYNPYQQGSPNPEKQGRSVSILDDDTDYFLISQNGKQYSIADHKDIQSCKGELIKECPKQFPLYDIKYESCLQAIWLDAPFKTILDICPYKLTHIGHAEKEHLFVQVVPISNGRWYIDAPLNDQWTIVCPQRPPEVRKSCTSCVVQVDCGCGIQSRWFEIPTRLSACTDVFAPFSHNYTINPFQYHMNTFPWIVNLTGSHEFPSPTPMIPDIDVPSNENWDDVMETLDSKQYDLNRLYGKQQNETKFYRTEAEALLEKIEQQDMLLEGIGSWPEWIITAALILSFVNSGCILLLCYCLISKGIHAASLTSRFTAERPIISPPSDVMVISLEMLILIIVTAVLILQIIMVWPIISQWLNSKKWFAKWNSSVRPIKACAFAHFTNQPVATVSGTAHFIWEMNRRQLPIAVQISCVPAGTHLQEIPSRPSAAEVTRVNGAYHVLLHDGYQLITQDDRQINVNEFYIDCDEVHEMYEVSPRYTLESLTSLQFSLVRV